MAKACMSALHRHAPTNGIIHACGGEGRGLRARRPRFSSPLTTSRTERGSVKTSRMSSVGSCCSIFSPDRVWTSRRVGQYGEALGTSGGGGSGRWRLRGMCVWSVGGWVVVVSCHSLSVVSLLTGLLLLVEGGVAGEGCGEHVTVTAQGERRGRLVTYVKSRRHQPHVLPHAHARGCTAPPLSHRSHMQLPTPRRLFRVRLAPKAQRHPSSQAQGRGSVQRSTTTAAPGSSLTIPTPSSHCEQAPNHRPSPPTTHARYSTLSSRSSVTDLVERFPQSSGFPCKGPRHS